jgi:hypothetical protein
MAFLTRDEILLLLKDEDTNILVFGVFSVPEQKAFIRCRLPFPDTPLQAYLTDGPGNLYGEICPASRAKMLKPDLKHRIVSLMYVHERRSHSFCVILQTGPFLKRCRELSNGLPETETFDWFKWSPGVTGCIPLGLVSPTGFRCTFGSCILTIGNPQIFIKNFTSSGRFLMLLDFNPIPIRRGFEERDGEGYYLRLVEGSVEWYTSPLHREYTISSSLPYRVFMRRWTASHFYLHLDANTIVARLVR